MLNKMNKAFFMIMLLLMSFPLFSQLLGETVATVTLTGTEGISSIELDRRMDQVIAARRQAGLPDTGINKGEVLDAMIAEILIRQAAAESGMTVKEEELLQIINGQKRGVEQQIGRPLTDPQFRELIRNQTGMTWDQYRSSIRDQILQQRYISTSKKSFFDAITPPSEKEIVEQYEDNTASITNPEYVRLRQIFVPTLNMNENAKAEVRKTLETAWSKLRNGSAKFEDLVLQYSQDETSKYRGGDVGYIARDDQRVQQTYGREFFRKLFELKEGEYSGVIESNVGIHILKVSEHREARILSLDDPIAPDNPMTVREYIRGGLYQEKQQAALKRALDAVVKELKNRAEIVTY
jgi:parvulin-like peptidyl-prolyl isomerase